MDISYPIPSGNLASLLARWGLSTAQWSNPLASGYSGAQLFRLIRRDGARFILKLTCRTADWIMLATEDMQFREAAVAAGVGTLLSNINTPLLGSAIQESFAWILMRDISDLLDRTKGVLNEQATEHVICGIARLHDCSDSSLSLPWCQTSHRLNLLTIPSADIADTCGKHELSQSIRTGWDHFRKLVPESISDGIFTIMDDPSTLIGLLESCPQHLLHGDLKLDNIGLDNTGQLHFIDWAMITRSNASLDLGWFMAVNSRRLPISLEETLERYRQARQTHLGDWPLQRDLAILCGLVLRGWRKSLDAVAGEPNELRWWVDNASRALERLN